MARPGVMLYFDMLEPIQALPDADKGRILQAILDYGKDGTDPQLKGMAALAWGFIKPRLDRDADSYENTKIQRRYAAFCRKRSGMNLPKVPFEQWLDLTEEQRMQLVTPEKQSQRPVDPVSSRYPTTTTTATTTATVTPTTTTTKTTNTAITTAAAANTDTTTGAEAPAAAAAERKLKRLHGELGQGVVNLSEYHIQRLLEVMGIDMFDHYVKKLSDFILREDASVKNHYQTILKWYTQDSAP